MARKDQYLICPIPLIAQMFESNEGIRDILDCAICYSAMHIQVNDKRTVFYALLVSYEYSKKDFPFEDLAFVISECLEDSDVTSQDISRLNNALMTGNWYKELSSYEDWEEYQERLDNLFSSFSDVMHENFDTNLPPFLEFWYKCYLMLKRLDMNPNYAGTLSIRGQQWFDNNNNCIWPRCPTFQINAETLWNICQDRDNLTDDRRAMWVLYFSIKSILGTKNFVATTSSLIMARMAGARSTKELCQVKDQLSPKQQEFYDKYTTRRRYDRLMELLQTNKMIVEYGSNHKTYLSVKMSLVNLIKEAKASTRKVKSELLKQDKAKAVAQALKELHSTSIFVKD